MDIFYSREDIEEIIIKNVLKMLFHRKIILNTSIKYEKGFDNTYIIPTNNLEVNNIKYDKIIILILNEKISGLTKSPLLKIFLQKNVKEYCIIISTSITEKSKNNIKSDNIEFFEEIFFLINLIDHKYSPKYKILTNKEIIEFKKSYNVNDNQIMKIFISDPISKYYNLKINDIIRITRINNGIPSIAYRIVIDDI